jgi:hypothetical protein
VSIEFALGYGTEIGHSRSQNNKGKF